MFTWRPQSIRKTCSDCDKLKKLLDWLVLGKGLMWEKSCRKLPRAREIAGEQGEIMNLEGVE